MRAREQPKQSAGLHQKHLKLLKSCWLWSKSLEGTNVHLELVSPLDHFSNRSLELGPPDLILLDES